MESLRYARIAIIHVYFNVFAFTVSLGSSLNPRPGQLYNDV